MSSTASGRQRFMSAASSASALPRRTFETGRSPVDRRCEAGAATQITTGAFVRFTGVRVRLPQREGEFERDQDGDRLPFSHGWAESPLLDRFDGLAIESER